MMTIRIVEEEYSQTLLHVKSVEITNTNVTATHKDGTVNVAEFQSPATIFIMVGKNTVDKVNR